MSKCKLITLFVLATISAICAAVLAACAPAEHIHTYSEDWSYNETSHWHKATCEHGDLKSGEAPHTDTQNNDGYCDICNYELAHHHKFDESQWLYDTLTHWNPPTCEHIAEKGNEAPHSDKDGDGKCDVCNSAVSPHVHSWGNWQSNETQHWLECSGCEETTSLGNHVDTDENELCDVCGNYVKHEHRFDSSLYDYDEARHWNLAVCKHTAEKGNISSHSFETGNVCVCGAKKNYIDVFNGLKEQSLLAQNKDYKSWIAELEEKDIIDVRITSAGDIIYEYSDNTSEGIYVARRQISVKALSDGAPVANVWFKLCVRVDGEYELFSDGTTDAISVAQTDESGRAEFSFLPQYGYTSANVVYCVRLAEAKDLAARLGQDETFYHPIPNRYTLHSTDNVLEYTVSEDYEGAEELGSFLFDFSKSWNASEKYTLPYARWYTDPLNGTGLDYEGLEFTLRTYGNGFYDYLYFIPSQKFGFGGYEGESAENKAKIEENYKKAASGEYQISFEIQDGENANVTLVLWNEGGVELESYYLSKADGTPDDIYVTSVSGRMAEGSGIAASKYTSENYVNVSVSVAQGLRAYQLGILSDAECTVTIKVRRTKDYEEDTSVKELTVGSNGNFALNGNGAVTQFKLRDVPSGYYTLTLTTDGAIQVGYLFAWFIQSQPYYLWSDGKYESLIEVPAGAEYLYIQNNRALGYSMNIKLVPFDGEPTLKLGETNWLPVSGANGKPMTIKIDKSSQTEGNNLYLADILIEGARLQQYEVSWNNVKQTSVTMELGGEVIKVPRFYGAPSLTCFLDITKGDEVVFKCDHPEYALFMIKVTFTPLSVLEERDEWYDFDDVNIYNRVKNVGQCYVKYWDTTSYALPFAFRATQGGTYKITFARDYSFYSNGPFLLTSDDLSPSHKSTNLFVAEEDGTYTYTFNLNAGETVIFIIPLMSVSDPDKKAELGTDLIKIELIN